MRKWQRGFMVEGLNAERFIQLAAQKNIRLKSVARNGNRRIDALAEEDAFPVLAGIAEEGGWQFIYGSRQGIGRILEHISRRWVLLIVCAVLAGALVAASRFMWKIEIGGDAIYTADVRDALHQLGIEQPMLRKKVPMKEIRSYLEWRYPYAAWVECGWRGTTLVVRIEDGEIPEQDKHAGVGYDVVASRAGIIDCIVTAAGTPVVSPGDTVQKGQLLIKGEERSEDGTFRRVEAQGCVTARVWDAVRVSCPVYGISTEYTGRTEILQQVVCPWFSLWENPESEFSYYDTSASTTALGGFFIPLQVRRETRYEAVFTENLQDITLLAEQMNAAAVQKLRQSAPTEDSYVDIWVNWSIIDDEILLSEAIGERLMDIAQQEPCSGMAATEQTEIP